MSLPSSRVYGGWLAAVRILTGCMWLLHGVPKFLNSAQFMPPNGVIVNYVQTGIAQTTGAYHDFLLNTVQPNIGIFAELVRFGEVCVGIALVFGAFTRLGGLVGVILTLDYIAGRGGFTTLGSWASLDACMALLSAINLVLPTGLVFGIDALVKRPPAVRRGAVKAEVVPEPPLDRPTAPRS